jgi:cell division protein ZapA (FtsZ GTPase activity inhibitor)
MNIMKRTHKIHWLLTILIVGFSVSAEAQVLKGFGKKLEKKIEQRIERKADRQVDKALDKADKKTDESIESALKKPESAPKKTKQAKSTPQFEPVAARPDQALVLVGNSCTDFSWFKKGALLAYEAIDNKGKIEGGIQMEVKELTSKGSATVAEVEARMSSPNFDNITYSMNYICDEDMIYMDIASVMKAMMDKNQQLNTKAAQEAIENMEMNFNDGYASFPKTMYPGMELDDLHFSFKTSAGGSEMSFETVVSDRQVVAREEVTTKAGTFECLKIRSVSNTAIKVMGMNQNMPASTEYLWIVPGIGMVKQEVQAGKETTMMQLKMYKL